MGQYWKYVNIDKKCSYGGGKLGQFFFDSQANLIHRLTIPAYPVNDIVQGSWAGERIISLGDYACDFPEGVMTPQEIAELEAVQAKDDQLDDLPFALWQTLGDAPRLTIPRSMAFSSKYIWVLRNLNKKEYVRSNGIPTLDQEEGKMTYEQHEGLQGGLGQVLLSRIGWSSDPSCAMCYGEEDHELQLHRGPWAGDRFDVRVFGECAEDMRDGGWVDVTRAAARQLFEIYRSDYGVPIGEFEPELEEDMDF